MPTPGADADGRDLELLGDQLGDLRRHRLELQHEAAGVLDRERVLEDLHRRFRGAPLDAEAAEHRHGVRREADVRGGRDAGVDQRLEDVRLRLAALRLHRVAARFLHEARRVDERAVDRVVALVGHAAEHERVRRAAAHRLRVQHHHVHRRRDGVGMAVAGHRERVADHAHVDPRGLRPFGRGVVEHRGVDHLLAGLLRVADLGDRALLALGSGSSGHRLLRVIDIRLTCYRRFDHAKTGQDPVYGQMRRVTGR